MSPYLLPFRFSLCKDQVAPGSVGPAGRIPLPGRPGLGTADRKEAWAQLLTVQSCHVNRKDLIPYFSQKNLLGETLRMLKCCFDKSKIPFYPLRIWVKNTGVCIGPRTNQPTTHVAAGATEQIQAWRQLGQVMSLGNPFPGYPYFRWNSSDNRHFEVPKWLTPNPSMSFPRKFAQLPFPGTTTPLRVFLKDIQQRTWHGGQWDICQWHANGKTTK